MEKVISFYKSTPGKKFVVALTGLILLSFVIGHMLGNLKTFAGVSSDGIHKLDHYANFLRTFGEQMAGHAGVLWVLRLGLIGAFVLHIVTIAQLQIRNKSARPTEYAKYNYRASSVAARSMMLGGIVILVFVLFHIAHLTLGYIQEQFFVAGHVYANVYIAFKQPLFVFLYLIALLFLGLHLFHGIWSVFQTLGLDSPDKNPTLRNLAKVIAIIVVVGFAAVPIGVYSGLTPEPPQTFIEH